MSLVRPPVIAAVATGARDLALRVALMSALTLAGCGADADAASTGDFVGTWHYDVAEATLTCPEPNPDMLRVPIGGNRTFATGVAAPLVDVTTTFVDPGIFCNFGFDVAGFIATGRVGQTCTLTGGADVLSLDGWTFTLIGPDKAEELADIGYAVIDVTVTPNKTRPCNVTLAAHLTRVSKD